MGTARRACQKSFFDTLSNETHCVGLSFEGAAARRSALAALARLRAEKYFCRRTRRRQKCFELYLRLRAQTLRGFFNKLTARSPDGDRAVYPFCGFLLLSVPSAAQEDGGTGKEQNGGGSGDGGNNRERFGVSFKNGSR